MREERIYKMDGSSKPCLYHFYPSVHALIEQEVDWRKHYESSTMNYGGVSWYGVEGGREGVFEALEKGWPEGTALMRSTLGDVQLPSLPSIKRKRKWSDAGDEVDIHRVNSGRLDKAWRRRERQATLRDSGSHITIAVDICCTGGTDSADAMWRGAAACAIAEAAINSGRSVRIVAVWSTGKTSPNLHRSDIACELKAYHQNVSTDVLMTMASLTGFFRVLGFKAWCAMGSEFPPHGSFGPCQEFNRKLLKDGSKMIWVGMDNLSPKKAKRVCDQAAAAMVRRVEPDEYTKTG